MTPNSVPLTSIYIPDAMGINTLTSGVNLKYDIDYTFELDSTDKLSIIKLNKIPFINYFNYNLDVKNWYMLDMFGNRWSFDNNIYTSYDNITLIDGETDSFSSELRESIYQYNPITLSINGVENTLTDITDYTGNIYISPHLNMSDTEKFKQFYYDKLTNIYTNQDLMQFDPNDIKLQYEYVNPSVKVKCILNTNSFGIVSHTPTVDYYILNMIGQDLI